MRELTDDQGKLINNVQALIDVEDFMSTCFGRLAVLIKNGKIRNRFIAFAQAAKETKKLLLDYLKGLGIDNFVLEDKCSFCKLSAESFSLSGSINLGLEITDVAINNYRTLISIIEDIDAVDLFTVDLFKKFLKDKIKQKEFLLKEKRFGHEENHKESLIGSFCMPYIASKF